MNHRNLTRRDLLASGGVALGSLALGRSAKAAPAPAPASAVAIGRCRTFDRAQVEQTMRKLFDQIGGMGSLVKNKTVAIKLNLTGKPIVPGRPELPYRYRSQHRAGRGSPHLAGRRTPHPHPRNVLPARQDMELSARYQLDINAINNVGRKVEWENGQNLGDGKQSYGSKCPPIPTCSVLRSEPLFVDCDTYVSLSKLKDHATAGSPCR